MPAEKKGAYREHAKAAAQLFKEYGALRVVEAWGDDVPDGNLTDFRSAVRAEPGEVVVFSWVEYPSKEVRDAAVERMFTDPRMRALGPMPFDGARLIYGGFDIIVDE